MKIPFIAFALVAAAASAAHATPRCTESQWHEAIGNAPARDGSILIAKTISGEPLSNSATVLVYDAQKEGYPLVCERRFTLSGVGLASRPAQRHPER